MCVIFLAETGRPNPKDLHDAAGTNDDGAGIAWVDKGVVSIMRGVGPQIARQVERLSAEAPLPFIVHYRQATVGRVTGRLSHPFPIPIIGGTPRAALAHNGHLYDWGTVLIRYGLKSRKWPEKGSGKDWSDTKAMAWILSTQPTKRWNSLLGQWVADGAGKLAVLEPDRLLIAGTWYPLTEGVRVSTFSFRPIPITTTTTVWKPGESDWWWANANGKSCEVCKAQPWVGKMEGVHLCRTCSETFRAFGGVS